MNYWGVVGFAICGFGTMFVDIVINKEDKIIATIGIVGMGICVALIGA